MGYPMTYQRVVKRNQLEGDYDPQENPKGAIRGDLRRLEKDQLDQLHLSRYAEKAEITDHQAWIVLTAFFEGDF